MTSHTTHRYNRQPEVLYVNYDENDVLDGEKLANIVGYAISLVKIYNSGDIGRCQSFGSWFYSIFEYYSRLGDGLLCVYKDYCCADEDRHNRTPQSLKRTVRFEQSNERVLRERLVLEMKTISAQNVHSLQRYDRVFGQVADHVVSALGSLPSCPTQGHHYRRHSLYDFRVVKTMREGLDLMISPCYMSFYAYVDDLDPLAPPVTLVNVDIDETNFTFTERMVKQIIKSLSERDYGF